MDNYLFKQLRFVRNNTIKQVTGMSDEKSCLVPQGFNNNVLWNLGHILLVHEKMEISKDFVELFSLVTKPVNWGKQVPGLDEIISLLNMKACISQPLKQLNRCFRSIKCSSKRIHELGEPTVV